MRVFNINKSKKFRRDLRQNQSQAEIVLWRRLRARQLNNLKFRRQYSIGPYVADFFCPAAKLVIELDGDSHYYSDANQKYDLRRDEYLNSLGLIVMRFLNPDIYANLEGVLESIAAKVKTTSP